MSLVSCLSSLVSRLSSLNSRLSASSLVSLLSPLFSRLSSLSSVISSLVSRLSSLVSLLSPLFSRLSSLVFVPRLRPSSLVSHLPPLFLVSSPRLPASPLRQFNRCSSSHLYFSSFFLSLSPLHYFSLSTLSSSLNPRVALCIPTVGPPSLLHLCASLDLMGSIFDRKFLPLDRMLPTPHLRPPAPSRDSVSYTSDASPPALALPTSQSARPVRSRQRPCGSARRCAARTTVALSSARRGSARCVPMAPW